MIEEQPLVTLKEIAKHLKINSKTAKKLLAKADVPLIEAYRPIIAVYPSTLRKYLER